MNTADPLPDHEFACHACRERVQTMAEAVQHVRRMVGEAPTPTRHAMVEVEEDSDRGHGWASKAKRIVYYEGGEVVVDAMRWDPHYRSTRPARVIALNNAERAKRVYHEGGG